MSLSTWQQIKVTFDGTTVRLFVEGALIASSTRPITLYTTTTTTPILSIGALPGEPTGATFAADAYLQQIRVRLECTNTAAFTVPTEGLPSWIGETPSKAISTQIPTPLGIRVQPVSGFAPVQFGTGFGQNLQRPTGFTTTQFGDHRLFPYHPAPFNSTQFGAGRLFPFHVAPGFRPIFGAVFAHQYWRAPSLGPIPRFGTPTTPTNRSQNSAGAARTIFGTPFSATVIYSGDDRTCQAFGWRAVRHGGHSAGWLHLAGASPTFSTTIGVPAAVYGAGAAGFAPIVFGLPAAAGNQRATGWLASLLGLPVSEVLLPATHKATTTRFGTPAGSDPNARRAYGVHSIRFGRPGGFSRFNYGAIGFACPHFGPVQCFEAHRVRQASTNTAFGKPQLSRSAQC